MFGRGLRKGRRVDVIKGYMIREKEDQKHDERAKKQQWQVQRYGIATCSLSTEDQAKPPPRDAPQMIILLPSTSDAMCPHCLAMSSRARSRRA